MQQHRSQPSTSGRPAACTSWHARSLVLAPPACQRLRRPTARSSATSAAAPIAAEAPQQQEERISAYVRPEKQTYAKEAITSTGSLRPGPEWFPAWMRYRRREDNYVFWEDKFSRNSMDIAYEERRWTLFSTIWYLAMQTRFYAVPPALRYVLHLAWRQAMTLLYHAHKALILWQCKVEADLAAKATGVLPSAAAASQQAAEGSSATPSGQQADAQGRGHQADQQEESAPGRRPGFSRAMALRRLHWQNSPLAEALYCFNVLKTGRVHMLPPKSRPLQRPTLFWLF